MQSNMERFATMMSDRMKQTSEAAVPTSVEFATVNSNLSITPDSLGVSIPAGEYKINIMLSGLIYTAYATHNHEGGGHGGHEGGDGSHTHTGGRHRHEMPETYRGLSPGDRVVIAWCGNEPVVLCIVV